MGIPFPIFSGLAGFGDRAGEERTAAARAAIIENSCCVSNVIGLLSIATAPALDDQRTV